MSWPATFTNALKHAIFVARLDLEPGMGAESGNASSVRLVF
jgi:hypothetical protein